MVDTMSGANIIAQMANKPSIPLDDPIKSQQEIENLRSTQLSNKKSAIGLNMDQSNSIARAMLQASMDPNATPESMAAEAGRLGQLYGVDGRIVDSWKSQIQPGMTQSQLKDLAMRGSMLALTPSEQYQASQPNVKYQNIGGRLVAITQNPGVGANPNQLSLQGGPDIKLTQPPDYVNTGPEILPRSEGAVSGRGIPLGTSPSIQDTGDAFVARPGQYGAGTVAPAGQLSQRDRMTPYKWTDAGGTVRNGVLDTYLAELAKGNASNGQPTGPAPGASSENGAGTSSGTGAVRSQSGLTTQPGPNAVDQKTREANLLANQEFYRQQQAIAANNAQAIRQGEDALDSLDKTNTGPRSERIYEAWSVANMLARQFGLPEIQPDNPQAYQELKKNLLAQARASGAASASVGQLEASLGSNPSEKMDPTVIRRMEMNIVGDLRIHNALVNSGAIHPELQDDFKNVYQRGRNTLQPLGAMEHRLSPDDARRLKEAIEKDKTGRLRALYDHTHNMMQNYGTGNVPGVTDIIQ